MQEGPEYGNSENTKMQAASLLIVEDNPMNSEMMVMFLRKKNYEVEAVGDGESALVRLAISRFDAVLMDIQLPGMDGLEIIRLIRERSEAAEICVIAVTAMAMPGDRERCLAAGADAYVSKPVSLEELDRLIRSLLGKKVERGRSR